MERQAPRVDNLLRHPKAVEMWTRQLHHDLTMKSKLADFMRREEEIWLAKPFHERAWIKIKHRAEDAWWRISGAWLVLVGKASWERM